MAKLPSLVQYWLRSSAEDLQAASTLLQGGHYRWAMFCCYLAVEKALKAVLQYQTGTLPPPVHDLRVRLHRIGAMPPVPLKRFIHQMAGLSVPTRYPGPLSTSRLGLKKQSIERAIRSTKEVLQWCRRNCR